MRLVVSAPTVRRVFAITGIDRLVGSYPTVNAALTAVDQPARDERPLPGLATTQTDPEGWAAQPR
jgi:hypothetical protein